jgi:hypothetical protein
MCLLTLPTSHPSDSPLNMVDTFQQNFVTKMQHSSGDTITYILVRYGEPQPQDTNRHPHKVTHKMKIQQIGKGTL